MTKDEFIKNLKGHQAQASAFTLKTGITGCIVIAIVFLLFWLKPFDDITGSKITMTTVLLAFIVSYLFISVRHEKTIDKNNAMYCRNCNLRFNHGTLAIAVLENKCQECGAKIYDT